MVGFDGVTIGLIRLPIHNKDDVCRVFDGTGVREYTVDGKDTFRRIDKPVVRWNMVTKMVVITNKIKKMIFFPKRKVKRTRAKSVINTWIQFSADIFVELFIQLSINNVIMDGIRYTVSTKHTS